MTTRCAPNKYHQQLARTCKLLLCITVSLQALLAFRQSPTGLDSDQHPRSSQNEHLVRSMAAAAAAAIEGPPSAWTSGFNLGFGPFQFNAGVSLPLNPFASLLGPQGASSPNKPPTPPPPPAPKASDHMSTLKNRNNTKNKKNKKPVAPANQNKKSKKTTTKRPAPAGASRRPAAGAAAANATASGTPTTLDQRLEAALDLGPGVRCGQVPIYARHYKRNINRTQEEQLDDGGGLGEFRILRGLEARVGEWPWVARVRECADEEVCGACTGTLLNSRWILTAGHCGANKSAQVGQFRGTLGQYDLLVPEQSALEVQFDKLIVHPSYRALTNDLTLLRMRQPVAFTDHIRPICLVNATRNVLAFARHRPCYTVGYGMTSDSSFALKLQKLRVTLRPPGECNEQRANGLALRQGTVCVGPSHNETGGACRGDSGGPDSCYDPRTDQWYLVGTVSYGPPVCERAREDDQWLTVSVDVSQYRSWILATILAHSQPDQ